MKKKEWARLLGYEPSKEQKALILAAVRDEGITLAEASARMALPPIYVEGRDEPGPDEYDNPFRPAIHITERDYNEIK